MERGTSDVGVHHLEVERLTTDAFEPFGTVLKVGDGQPDFRGVGTHAWATEFQAEGDAQVMMLESWYQGLSFSVLERHFAVSQTFVMVGGSPAVVAVAAPAATGSKAAPEPNTVRAFVLEPTDGYILRQGTWHSLDRFPLYPPAARFVIITTTETTAELKSQPQAEWRLTEAYDYRESLGLTFEILLGSEEEAARR